jgi:thioredoxin reductase
MINEVDYVVVGVSLSGISAALNLVKSDIRVVLVDFDRDTDAIGDVPFFLATPLGSPMRGADFEHAMRDVLVDTRIEYRSDCHVTNVVCDGKAVVECTNKRWSSLGVVFAPNGTEPGLPIKGARELEGFGVSYSAAADAPFFASRRVAVYGDVPRVLEHAYVAAQFASEVVILAKAKLEDRNPPLLAELRALPSVRIIEGARVVSLRSSDGGLSGIEFDTVHGQQTINVSALFVAQEVQPDMTVLRGRAAPNIVMAGLAAGVPYWRHQALVADGDRVARELVAAHGYR